MLKKFIIIGFILFFSCLREKNNDDINNESDKKINSKSIGITATTISSTTFNKQLIANGKVIAIQKADLRFKTSNTLKNINRLNGQTVKKQELIANLDNNLLKNQVKNTEILLLEAKNKLQQEKINYGFYGKKEKEVPTGVVKNIQIKSGVLSAKNNFERATIEYDQTFLRAPFSGIIANIEKKEGDFIASSEVFCTLINPHNLEVSFSILESEYPFVSKNQEIEIQSFNSEDVKFTGIITEINPLVDKNGLIKIKAKVSSTKTRLLDGMNVKVFINKPLKNVIVIPKEALVLRSNKEVVFTVKKGIAKWNYVKLAGENSNTYAIKKGLQPTDTIIVSGNLNLAHDTKVKMNLVRSQ